MKRLIGLIGDPVAHSKSPQMHNVQFESLGLPFSYHAFQVPDEMLSGAVSGMKALGFKGFNVTIPHKVAVMEYLDEVSDEAMRIGAVNTVVNESGKLVGYNTDGKGYLLSLEKETGISLKGKKLLVIGAGGAARALLVTLLEGGAGRVDIANRSLEKARALVRALSQGACKVLSLPEAEQRLGDYDLIVNTTPVGMSPNIEQSPIKVENIKPGAIASDIVYNPLETEFLQQSRKKGAVIHTGIGMFAGQGALAFERWTGRIPDFEAMKRTVLEEMNGSHGQ
ncbi:shikimate dehydrogenase [Bacillus marinisedimentorum]|uniref:shikimate dehydrogenase n=1 Tax=Bacillus marinisedimentorum TaxID=1821260 RepID=UPI0008733FA8|nr:shikimate dehydrogenase [Bacillus marinisedimentorum]